MGSTKSLSYSIKINVDGKDINISTESLRDLIHAMDDAKGKAESLHKQFFRFNTAIETFRYAANGVQQIADVFNSLTDESRSFDAAMKAANTMAGKGSAGFEDLKDRVSELAKEIPLARDELANGLYQVISNGVPEDNWIDYLRASSRSAVGGIADVGEVVKVTSTIIKNYGLEWSAAQDIQDKIQLTAKNGVTSFEQLAAALPSVTGQAAQLGVSFTEMLAVMSTLTGVTGNTSEVSTQLASVLTALTKESSKSQKMAEEMGISFNAASIKAAGGFRNFLQELDRSVTAYAQKTGRLKESIYSQLFGRAEASRLISALTGNLSEKFSENIAALEQSVGTMDASFGDMASTGAAQLQLLKNEFSGIGDFIQNTIGGILPILNFGSQIGMSVVAVGGLSKAFTLLTAKMSGTALVQTLITLRNRIMASSFMQAAMAANGLQRSLMLLMAAGGIAAAIMVLVSAINSLVGKSKEAGDQMSETAREASDAFVQASAQAKAQINEDVRKLKGLMDAHADTSAAVRDLNARYGDIFGTFSTAAQWYDTLIGKSEAYCRQIGYEAQLKKIYEKKAETEIKLQQNEDRQAELKSQGKDRVIAYTSSGTSISGYTQSVAYETKSDEQNRLEKENQTLQGELREQERLEAAARKKIEDNNFRPVNPTGNTPPTTPTTTPTRNTGSTANVLKEIAGAKTYEQLANNIRYYDEQLRKTDPAEKAIIESWAKKKKIAEDAPVIRCLMLSLLSLESPKYLCLRRLASGIN